MKSKIPTITLIVAFSILLWIFVSFSGEFSISLNLPIQIINVPENNSVSSISSDEIAISLKGQGWQLAQHTLGRDPKFYIPSPSEPGEKEIPVRNALGSNSWLATTLQLAEINPEKIKIKIEPTKSVLKILTPRYTSSDITECQVNFDVQKIVDKTFDDLVVETRSIPSRYELIVAPTKISVILRGGINMLSKIKNEDIKSYVKFEQAINDTTGAIEPIIEIPEFTSLIDIKPDRLDYIIKKF